ncbi:TIGR03943 family putative permease subunit [Alteribacter natronophilus]|uniref:TIGR03943 family putative permease subunit n=1 Tax=Alteribacter natronophilus TaxID=2583810 RepID=UPI00110D8046|nr:TIGR03943 family protein [Alteribacter natronophilus]TMW73692.1 TIGR03943 family protein [Alteribacter natronophilus]
MRDYDFSFHAFIQGIILIGFALLMLWFVLSGNIVYYIAPKMMPFVYFALVTFFLLGIVQVFRSTRKSDADGVSCTCGHDHRIPGPPIVKLLIYGIFILPVLMGFVLPDRALDSSVAQNRGMIYGSGNSPTVNAATQAQAAETGTEQSSAEEYLEDPEGYMENLESGAAPDENDLPGPDDVQEHFTVEDFYDQEGFDQYYVELAEKLQHEDVITVTEENYLDIMTVMDVHLDKFIGKDIEIVGFAFREPDFDDHQLVAARFSMTCCTADAGVYGTLIESNQAADIEEDTWIHVYGTIKEGEYNGYRLPVITDADLNEVEEPASPYVYPSFRF